MLAMQVLNLTAVSCSTSSYINWYIVETFKEVQDQGGLLGKDSRAKEAEEAMAPAAAEAAEMTRLLELERSGGLSQTDLESVSVPALEESSPKTTFASLLRDPDILPPPNRVETVPPQATVLPPPPPQIDSVEATIKR